jgi:hypothetical protein
VLWFFDHSLSLAPPGVEPRSFLDCARTPYFRPDFSKDAQESRPSGVCLYGTPQERLRGRRAVAAGGPRARRQHNLPCATRTVRGSSGRQGPDDHQLSRDSAPEP